MRQMRLLQLIVLVCIIIVSGRAADAAPGMTLEISGKKLGDVPFVVEKGELLVPGRLVVEEFGGKLIWYDLLKVFVATFDDGYEIKMRVGDINVQIAPGDQVQKLTVPPRQVNGQVMIPLRFLAQQFGYLFKWDEARRYAKVYKPTNWVQGITFEEGLLGEFLVISSTEKVGYKPYVLSNPDRLVIDISDSVLSVKAANLSKETFAFKNVKFAQFDAETVRVVVELNNHVQYKVLDEAQNGGYVIKVAFASGIRQVSVTEQGLAIHSSGEIGQYKVMEFTNPNRLVIDIYDQNLQLAETTIPLDHPLIKQVRASQHSWEPKIARLVLDLDEKIDYNVLRGKTAREIIIQPKNAAKPTTPTKPADPKTPPAQPGTTKPTTPVQSGSTAKPGETALDKPAAGSETKPGTATTPSGTGQATKPPASPGIKPAADEVILAEAKEYGDKELVSVGLVNDGQKVTVRTSTPVTYEVYHLVNPERLVIDLMGVKTKLTQDQITVSKGDVKCVRMHQHPDKVRIVFDLGKYEGHRVLSEKRAQTVEITLGYSTLAGSVIVVDPGHGGSDPGAVGAKGTFEKTINLAVALKLAELLKGAGAKVVMTRDSDVYPTLGERVDLANQLNADIFVSIHCNSLQRVDPGGTEVFVAPRSAIASMSLAQAVHKNLVKQIGLFDRGIKSNEFYVLNHTNMPSILVELAFISKSEEEALLNDPAFQDKAALGIYEGIRLYFTQTAESRGGKK